MVVGSTAYRFYCLEESPNDFFRKVPIRNKEFVMGLSSNKKEDTNLFFDKG